MILIIRFWITTHVNIYVSTMLILMITNKIKNDSVFEKLKLFLYILNKSLFSHLKVLYLMDKWFYEIGCFSSLWFNWKSFENFEINKYCLKFWRRIYLKSIHSILGYIIISKSFGNSKHYLEILKLDLFENFHNVLGHNTVL